MTIAELITALAAYDPNLPVIIRSYEAGYDNVRAFETVKVTTVPNPAWYDGELDKIWDDDAPASPVDFVALHLACGARD